MNTLPVPSAPSISSRAGAPLRVLFIAARFPFPALKGDQVRAYHQLRLLAQRHRITLLSFADGPIDARDRAHVAEFCDDVITIPLSRLDMAAAVARNLLTALPVQTMMYQTAPMRAAVNEQLARGFDVVHVQLARMAEHVVDGRTPCVVDLIDALSLNMERRAKEQRGPLKFAAGLEAGRMQRYERQLCERAGELCVVSAVDRDAIGAYANIHVNANGVDVQRFAYSRANRRPNTLVFSGNMGYFPNVNAVTWFAREVLPRVKAAIPTVAFEIVGTNPTREVRALAERDSAVSVTGFVPDLRAHLERAAVGVVSMRAGTGIQNKVIEAMACGTPLVATPFALGGIAAAHDRHLLIGEDAATFAAQTIRLLGDAPLQERLALAARELVERDYSWESSVGALDSLYRQAAASAVSSTLGTL